MSIISTRNRVVDDGIQQSSASGKEAIGRRKLLRGATGLGAAVVGAIAVTWADAPEAYAVSAGCCNLATNTPCGGSWGRDGNFNCPSGTTKGYWTCYTQGGFFLYHCWECCSGCRDVNNGCYGSNYRCSNYWDIYIP